MKKSIILACLCALSLGSCKKDYYKLATEFERALPDTLVVLTEQINELDHHIYYKNKGNTELIRYDLDKETKESIKPELSSGESIYGIYAGKENFTILKHSSMASELLTYNLKTQKFKEVESFWGTENNDAFADENEKTVTGYVGLNGGPTTKYVYDFDGNLVSQEEEEEPVGDLDVPSLKYWQCVYCHLILKSSSEPQGLGGANCPMAPKGYYFHSWQCVGEAY